MLDVYARYLNRCSCEPLFSRQTPSRLLIIVYSLIFVCGDERRNGLPIPRDSASQMAELAIFEREEGFRFTFNRGSAIEQKPVSLNS